MHNINVTVLLTQHPRSHLSVATVVAVAADDDDAPRRGQLRTDAGQRTAGSLHQRLRRDVVLLDRPGVKCPLLRGVG